VFDQILAAVTVPNVESLRLAVVAVLSAHIVVAGTMSLAKDWSCQSSEHGRRVGCQNEENERGRSAEVARCDTTCGLRVM